MVRQVQRPEGRRKATKEEIEDFKSWKHERPSKGLPPWAGRDGKDGLDVLQSSQTLRQWADEYCASPKLLKEFVYEKVSFMTILRRRDSQTTVHTRMEYESPRRRHP